MEERIRNCLEAAFADFANEKPVVLMPAQVASFHSVANNYLQRNNLIPRGVKHFTQQAVTVFLEERGYKLKIVRRNRNHDYKGYKLMK